MPLDTHFTAWFIRDMRQIKNKINSKSEILNPKQNQNLNESQSEKGFEVKFGPVVKFDLKAFLALFKQFVLVGGDLA